MNAICLETILPRIDYIREIHMHPSSCFENFIQPAAVYERDGKIVRATMKFLELAGITEDDIKKGNVNMYDCLNGENEGITDAARDAFGNTEKLLPTPVQPLIYCTEYAQLQLSKYKHAVFFPIEWLDHTRKTVDCCSVLLIAEPQIGEEQ